MRVTVYGSEGWGSSPSERARSEPLPFDDLAVLKGTYACLHYLQPGLGLATLGLRGSLKSLRPRLHVYRVGAKPTPLQVDHGCPDHQRNKRYQDDHQDDHRYHPHHA